MSMKDTEEFKELERQIALGWNRGFQLGLAIGITGTLIGGFLIKILW